MCTQKYALTCLVEPAFDSGLDQLRPAHAGVRPEGAVLAELLSVLVEAAPSDGVVVVGVVGSHSVSPPGKIKDRGGRKHDRSLFGVESKACQRIYSKKNHS